MNLFLKLNAVALGLLVAHSAVAQNEGVAIVTTLTTIVAGAGTTVMVVTLMDRKHAKAEDVSKAEKLAEIFLKDNRLQLAQDLNSGAGRMINELAGALDIPEALRERLGTTLKANRSRLLSLSDIKDLNPQRAGLFMRTIAELAENDSMLHSSLMAFKKKHKI